MSAELDGDENKGVDAIGAWGALERRWAGDEERDRARADGASRTTGNGAQETMEDLRDKPETSDEGREQGQSSESEKPEASEENNLEKANLLRLFREEKRKREAEQARVEQQRRALLKEPLPDALRDRMAQLEMEAAESGDPNAQKRMEEAAEEALVTEFVSVGNRHAQGGPVGGELATLKQNHAKVEWGYEGKPLSNKDFLDKGRAYYDLQDRVMAAGGAAALFKLVPVEAREAAIHQLRVSGHQAWNPAMIDRYRTWFDDSMHKTEGEARAIGRMAQRKLPGFALGNLFARPPEPEVATNRDIVVSEDAGGAPRVVARWDQFYYTITDKNMPLRGVVKAAGEHKMYFRNEVAGAIVENQPVQMPRAESGGPKSVLEFWLGLFKGDIIPLPSSQPRQALSAFSGVEQKRRDREAHYAKEAGSLWQKRVNLLTETERRAQEILSAPTDEKTKDLEMLRLRAESGKQMAALSDAKNKMLREVHAEVVKGEVSVQDYFQTGHTLGIWDVTEGRQDEPPQSHLWEDQVTEVARLREVPTMVKTADKLDVLDATYAKDMAELAPELEKGGDEGKSAAESLTDFYVKERQRTLEEGAATYRALWRDLAPVHMTSRGILQTGEYRAYLEHLKDEVMVLEEFLGGVPEAGKVPAYDGAVAKYNRELELQSFGSSTTALKIATELGKRHGVSAAEVEKMVRAIDLTVNWENGDKARLLPSGEIMVNPSAWIDEEKYRAAIGSIDASPEAKKRALAMFPTLEEAALDELFTTLSGYKGFDEDLRKYSGTTKESVKQFIADANKRPIRSKLWDSLLSGGTGVLTSSAGAVAGGTGSERAHDAMAAFHEQQMAFSVSASLAKTGPTAEFAAKLVEGAPSVLMMWGPGRAVGLTARLFGAGTAGVRTATMAGATLGAMGQSFGSGYDAAVYHLRHQGMPEEMARREALKPAVVNGLVSGVMAYWGRNSGVEAFLKGPAGREMVKRTLWEQGKAMGRDYLKDFGEDGFESLVEGFVAKVTYEPGRSLQDIFSDAWDSAKVSGALGVAVSGAGTTAQWWSGGRDASAVAPDNVVNNRANVGIDTSGADANIGSPGIGGSQHGENATADGNAASKDVMTVSDASRTADWSEPDRFSFSNAADGNTDPFQPKAFGVRHYLKKLKAWMNGEDIGRDVIGMGPTPPVLRVVGADALSLVVPPGLFTKVTQDAHQVPIEALEQLPQALADPVAIFQSRTHPDSVVVLTEFEEAGEGPMIAAVHLGKTAGRNFVVNEVASYYGKNAQNVASMFGEGLLYENPQKSLVWARRVGLQLPKRGTPSQGQTKVAHPEDVVKFAQSLPGAKPLSEGSLPPQGTGVYVTAQEAQEALAKIRQHSPEMLHDDMVLVFPNPAELAASPHAGDYTTEDLAQLQGREGAHDRKTGKSLIFTGQIELRKGETAQMAVERVLEHERVGHEGVNYLLRTDPKTAAKWKELIKLIRPEQLSGLSNRGYEHLADNTEALALEWLAQQVDHHRQGKSLAQMQRSLPSVAQQMWQVLKEWVAGRLKRRGQSDQGALDLDQEVASLLDQARNAVVSGKTRKAASGDPAVKGRFQQSTANPEEGSGAPMPAPGPQPAQGAVTASTQAISLPPDWHTSSLSAELQPFEAAMKKLVENTTEADRVYNALPESKGGKVINTDIARSILPAYAESREGRMRHTPSTNTPAKVYAADRLRREIQNRGNRTKLMFTAGGVAAGKSTVADDALVAEQDLVFDGTMRDTRQAIKTIQAALDHGWTIQINYVQRPIELVIPGAIDRANEIGRWIPISDLPNIHADAQRSIIEIARHFAGESRVEVDLWLNKGKSKEERPSTIILKDIDEGGPLSFAHADFRTRGKEAVRNAFENAVKSGKYERRLLELVAGQDPVLLEILNAHPKH